MWFHHPVANAALIDFGLNLGGGNVGTTHNFVSGGLTLGAASQGVGAGSLFLKCCDAGETGLGLTGDREPGMTKSSLKASRKMNNRIMWNSISPG